jgi:hypothetical protein
MDQVLPEAAQEPELMEACASGDVGRVKALLYVKRTSEARRRALLARDPKRRNQTPLHLAIINGLAPSPSLLFIFIFIFIFIFKTELNFYS